jgi:peroxiredoxin
MALTDSNMLKLGTKAPDFELKDVVSGKTYSLSDLSDKKGLLVMFICRHCPYVQHIEEEIADIGLDYEGKDIAIIAISSNDADDYSEDTPERLAEQAKELGFTFPYLYDKDQSVAKAYTAACTPDFFLFQATNLEYELIYRGQLDGSRPGSNVPVTGEDLRNAINALLEGKDIPKDQKPSQGCNIKWKAGNEPDYY